MSVPSSFENFLDVIETHKSELQSHTYVMQHQNPIAVLFDPLLPESPRRQNVTTLVNRSGAVIDNRLADTIANLVNNLRKQRTKNARSH